MKITETISVLKEILEIHGDIPCLIEYFDYDLEIIKVEEVGEISVSNRNKYGESAMFII